MAADQSPLTPEHTEAIIGKLDAERDMLVQQGNYLASQHRREEALASHAELLFADAERVARLSDAQRKRNRVYDFIDEVSVKSVESAMQEIAQWARLSDEPITVCLHTPGGNVLAGLRLYDFLRAVVARGIELTTVVYGMAASMGGILLQAGSRRVAAPESWVLVHEVSASAVGKVGEMEDMTAFMRRLNDRLFDILTRRAKISKAALINRAKRKDYWMTAQDALKAGLVDEIAFL